jgi:hypothetical protein
VSPGRSKLKSVSTELTAVYNRYLIMTRTNYTQLKVHQRMSHLRHHPSMDGYDMRTSFPRLRCMAWYRHLATLSRNQDEFELHMEIYKPICLVDLIEQGYRTNGSIMGNVKPTPSKSIWWISLPA